MSECDSTISTTNKSKLPPKWMLVLPAFYPFVFFLFKVMYSVRSVLHNYTSAYTGTPGRHQNQVGNGGWDHSSLAVSLHLHWSQAHPQWQRVTSLAAALALMLPCSKLLWEVNQIIVTRSSQAISFQLNLGLKLAHFTFTLVTAMLQVITGSLNRNCL